LAVRRTCFHEQAEQIGAVIARLVASAFGGIAFLAESAVCLLDP